MCVFFCSFRLFSESPFQWSQIGSLVHFKPVMPAGSLVLILLEASKCVWMGVSGKEQIFILIDTFFYMLSHGCQLLSSLVVVNAKSIHGFTTSCQDKCKLHFPSEEGVQRNLSLVCLQPVSRGPSCKDFQCLKQAQQWLLFLGSLEQLEWESDWSLVPILWYRSGSSNVLSGSVLVSSSLATHSYIAKWLFIERKLFGHPGRGER